jgi:hypothetical protein
MIGNRSILRAESKLNFDFRSCSTIVCYIMYYGVSKTITPLSHVRILGRYQQLEWELKVRVLLLMLILNSRPKVNLLENNKSILLYFRGGYKRQHWQHRNTATKVRHSFVFTRWLPRCKFKYLLFVLVMVAFY